MKLSIFRSAFFVVLFLSTIALKASADDYVYPLSFTVEGHAKNVPRYYNELYGVIAPSALRPGVGHYKKPFYSHTAYVFSIEGDYFHFDVYNTNVGDEGRITLKVSEVYSERMTRYIGFEVVGRLVSEESTADFDMNVNSLFSLTVFSFGGENYYTLRVGYEFYNESIHGEHYLNSSLNPETREVLDFVSGNQRDITFLKSLTRKQLDELDLKYDALKLAAQTAYELKGQENVRWYDENYGRDGAYDTYNATIQANSEWYLGRIKELDFKKSDEKEWIMKGQEGVLSPF